MFAAKGCFASFLAATTSFAVGVPATARANAMADLIDRQNTIDAASFANSSLAKFDITINTGVGDPNAIAEALENLLREANARGTLTSGILSIA